MYGERFELVPIKRNMGQLLSTTTIKYIQKKKESANEIMNWFCSFTKRSSLLQETGNMKLHTVLFKGYNVSRRIVVFVCCSYEELSCGVLRNHPPF